MTELPISWIEAPIEELGLPSTPNLNPSKYPEEVFELYSVPSFADGKPEIIRGKEIKSAKQIVQPGDVLLCKIVPHLNRVWVVGERGDYQQIASGEWIVVRSPLCDPYYLRYGLSEPMFREKFMETVSGVGGSLLRARPKAVAKIQLPLAPAPEQRRIAAKLDSLFARTRKARAELARIPILIEHYKQAILTAAFRGNIGKKSRFKGFPLFTLGELMISSFYGPRFSRDSYVTNGGVQTLRTTDFTDWGEINPKTPPRVIVNEKEFEKWSLQDGDLLVTRTGSIGKCAVYRDHIGPALPSAYLIRLRLDKVRVEPDFILRFLLSLEGQRQLGLGVTAVTQPNINARAIASIRVPLPSLEEQREILHQIDVAWTWISNLVHEYESAFRLVSCLDQALLSTTFRGKLIPQDPNDEPAHMLLERIRAERRDVAGSRRGRHRTTTRQAALLE